MNTISLNQMAIEENPTLIETSSNQVIEASSILSSQNKSWLDQYCLAIMQADEQKVKSALPAHLYSRLVELDFEPEGDYFQQIGEMDLELTHSRLRISHDLMVNQHRVVILGKAGSGKSYQLQAWQLQYTHRLLTQIDETNNIAVFNSFDKTPMLLPVYVNLREVSKALLELQEQELPTLTNLFQYIIESTLAKVAGETIPDAQKLFQKVVPLLLLDNLEQLEMSLAPLFFYHLNQWQTKNLTDVRICFSCRQLDFALYHSWFKLDQKWQLYNLIGFDWNELRLVLLDKVSTLRLTEIEKTGLTVLFTNPALSAILYSQILEHGLTGLSQLLKLFLESISIEQGDCASTLAYYSRLLNTPVVSLPLPVVEQLNYSENAFSRVIKLGLLEKHPVAGWLRLSDTALDCLIAAWFCLQLDHQTIQTTLDEVIAKAEALDVDTKSSFLQLLYLVIDNDIEKDVILDTLLGPNPDTARLKRISTSTQLDQTFPAHWKAYLKHLINSSKNTASTQRLLRLCVSLLDKLGVSLNSGLKVSFDAATRQDWSMAEVAIELLIELGQTEPELYLGLGYVQEQFGRQNQALQNYRLALKASSTGLNYNAALAIARLLTTIQDYNEASTQLLDISHSLQRLQAQIDNQISVVKRSQGNFEEALTYAGRAVEIDQQPSYNHSLALALAATGEKYQAEQLLEKIVSLKSDFSPAYYDLGRLQLERGADSVGLVNLRRAVELNPESVQYLYDLGRSLLAQQRYGEAYHYLQVACSQSEVPVNYLIMFGLASLKLDHFEEARSSFLRSLRQENSTANVYSIVYLAATEFNSNNNLAAFSYLEQGLKQEPLHLLLLLLHGLVAEATGKIKQALNSYIKAESLTDANATPASIRLRLLMGLTRSLRQSGKSEEATKYAQEAFELYPETAEVQFECGLLAMQRQAYTEATKYFQDGIRFLKSDKSQLKGTTSIAITHSLSQFEHDWLGLFKLRDQLDFELPFNKALALYKIGQYQDAQALLQEQLEVLGNSIYSYRSPEAARKALIHYHIGLNLLATNNFRVATNYLGLAVSAETNNARYILSLAQAWRGAGNIELAWQHLNRVRELDPKQPQVYIEMAELSSQGTQGFTDTKQLLASTNNNLFSLNMYLQALELEPTNLRFIYKAALLAYQLQHLNQADELISRLNNNVDASAHLLTACIRENKGELTQAREEIEKSLEVVNGDKTPYLLVAARLARKTNALIDLKRILEQLPSQPKPQLHVRAAIGVEAAWLATSQKQYAQAAELYSQSVGLYAQGIASGMSLTLDDFYYEDRDIYQDPGDRKLVSLALLSKNSYAQTFVTTYRLKYVSTLRQLAQFDTALAQLEELIAVNPQLAQVYELKGEILFQQGQFAQALEPLTKAVELEATPNRLYQLGMTQLELENFQDAAITLERVVEGPTNPFTDNSEFYGNLGTAYEKSNQFRAASTAYTRAIQISPSDPKLHSALARCYVGSGEQLAAVQPMQSAVISEPGNLDHRFKLAELYERLGWLQEAASEYEQITVLFPTNATGWLKRGLVLNLLGQPSNAAFEQALSLDDNLDEAHYEIGVAFLNEYQINQKRSQSYFLPSDLQGMFGEALAEPTVVAAG